MNAFKHNGNPIGASRSQSRLLMVTSCGYLIPTIYSYLKCLPYYYTADYLLVALCSLNFWRDPRYCWRRTLDMIVAQGNFIGNGILIYLNGTKTPKVMYVLVVLAIINYGFAEYFFQKGKVGWVKSRQIWAKFHLAFHLTIICAQMLMVNLLSKTFGGAKECVL